MKNLIMLCSALLILASCANENENENLARSTGQEIYFEETTHNYGNILIESDGSYKFVFKNIGEEALVVNKVRSSCGCTVPFWPKEPIEPGKSGEIEVKYNTALAGSFMKTVVVYSSATNSPVKLVIKGKVVEEEGETEIN